MPRLNLRRCFNGVDEGEVCTGTVHALGLRSSDLLRDGVIRLTADGRDYVLVKVPKKVRR